MATCASNGLAEVVPQTVSPVLEGLESLTIEVSGRTRDTRIATFDSGRGPYSVRQYFLSV